MNSTPYPPIRTQYRDCYFRSRLEARWAVFFDQMQIAWAYEPEGFTLPSGRQYLPDFYLPGLEVWVEIKPPQPDNGQPWMEDGSVEAEFFCGDKTEYLRHIRNGGLPQRWGSGPSGFVIFGTPGVPKPYEADSPYACAVAGDSPYFWCECVGCGAVGCQFDGRAARNKHASGCARRGGDKDYAWDTPRLTQAFTAARAFSFWDR